ncbi:hypothetical protein HMI56_003629 [Coelomomyces lativittatus]|nr:hypothetical protein HMI56_003629 [Coelomomyces lativittatus]
MWLNVAHCPTFPSLYHGFQTSFEGTFLVYLDLSHCGFIDMMVLTFPCLMHLNISHNQIK